MYNNSLGGEVQEWGLSYEFSRGLAVDTESKLIVLVGRRCGAVTSIRHFD
jgi:hypothetical protein